MEIYSITILTEMVFIFRLGSQELIAFSHINCQQRALIYEVSWNVKDSYKRNIWRHDLLAICGEFVRVN